LGLAKLERWQIVGFSQRDFSNRKVEEQMRILQSVIDHIVQHVRPPGTVDERLQSGRLNKTTLDNRLKTHHAQCLIIRQNGKNK
jgi:hypothetical protein